jgi:hypothetical protein
MEGKLRIRLLVVFLQPAQVEFHLAFVLGAKVAQLDVKVALEGVFHAAQHAQMRPAQFGTQCVHNLLIGETFGKEQAESQLSLTSPFAVNLSEPFG